MRRNRHNRFAGTETLADRMEVLGHVIAGMSIRDQAGMYQCSRQAVWVARQRAVSGVFAAAERACVRAGLITT